MKTLKQLLFTLVVGCTLALAGCSDDSNPPPINYDGGMETGPTMEAGPTPEAGAKDLGVLPEASSD